MRKHIDTFSRQKGLPEPKAIKYKTNKLQMNKNGTEHVNDREREGTKNNYVLFHPRDSKLKKSTVVDAKPLSSIKPQSTSMYNNSNNDKRDQFTCETVNKISTSTILKNVPIRAKKRSVSHMENYCLFDPSTDFFNEREHVLGTIPETLAVENINPLPSYNNIGKFKTEEYDTIEEVDETETDNLNDCLVRMDIPVSVSTQLDSAHLPLPPKLRVKANISINKNMSIKQTQTSDCDVLCFNNTVSLCTNVSEDLGAASNSPVNGADNLSDVMTIEEFIKIYTEWANYYLERSKSKKRFVDLSIDCRDGLLLAEVIEAVTTFKVPDLIKKPKTQKQMYDNVNSCLNLLKQQQVTGLETINANDICAGRLKAILSLFFALSRYKQATKLRGPRKEATMPISASYQQQAQQTSTEMINRTAPTSNTSIPVPATVIIQRRCPPDKVRPLPPTPNHQTSSAASKQTTNVLIESRPESPQNNSAHIPKVNNSLRQPQTLCKIPASPYSTQINGGTTNQNGTVCTSTHQQTNISTTKHSMSLLRLFNKEKSDRTKSHVSKRTSSSSGFSSAKSERSDSSLSLNEGHTTKTKCANEKDIKKHESENSAKSKTKLLLSKSSKDKKSEKKEKISSSKKEALQSVEHYNDSNITIVDSKFLPPKSQKAQSPATSLETKNQLPPAGKKLEKKSESKTSLSSLSQSHSSKTSISVQSSSIQTGIPKPMAAVKGTTKPSNNISPSHVPQQQKSQNNNISINGFDKSQPQSNTGNNNNQLHAQILNQANVVMTDSQHSTHSTSTGNQSNSSESSVIYRPSSESGSDILHSNISTNYPKNPIPNRKIDNFSNDPLIKNDGEYNINGNKFNTVPSKTLNAATYEEQIQISLVPMRPLLRGYNNHVTLPRGIRTGQHIVSEYCEDIRQQGYNSDGDSLLKTQARYSDIENGYMSEGGTPTKNYLSMLRARSHLPTTIEEKCRTSIENILENEKIPMDAQDNKGIRNGRDYWGKLPEPQNSDQSSETPSSPTSSRKDKGSPNHSKRGAVSAAVKGINRTKGVPQSFGYIKRTNGTSAEIMQGGRTAHVSAVPRSNKLKVSGGTQTANADFQQKIPHHSQYRSFSLTGPGAAQLSQSVKERFGSGTRSLPKSGLEMHVFPHRMTNRGSAKLLDGSLSDTQTYAEVKPDYSTYAMWLKHSNTATSRLSEGDATENNSVGSPCLPRNYKLLHHRDNTLIQSPRLNRSNSIRSTKSEKMYPSMLSRGPDVEIEPYYCLPIGAVQGNSAIPWSQPTSPTPTRGLGGILSPTHSSHRMTYPKKNDEVHGSQASLLSGGSSSIYGSTDDRQIHEVRRLKRELADAREQILSLSSQLSTNAHVVSAFEQSLSNMTTRLQQLQTTTEKKDSEILEMRQTIELLRKQSIQAGLTSAHMQSMGVNGKSQHLGSSHMVNAQMKKYQNDTLPPLPPPNGSTLQRNHSSDSMCSLNSISSGCSTQDKKKKKGWLRSSFTKAFSRNAKISKTNRQVNQSSNLDISAQSSHASGQSLDTINQSCSPKQGSPHKSVIIIENAKPIDAVDLEGNPVVEDLKKQLREKDLVLTDIRLEALNSASQLENLKETVMKMRAEMINLKQNNERLQRLVTTRSLAGSETELGTAPVSPSESRRYSLATDNTGTSNVSRPVNTSVIEEMLETQLNEMLSILQPLPKHLDDNDEFPPAPAPEPPTNQLSPVKLSALTPTMDTSSLSSGVLNAPTEDAGDPRDGKKISIAVYLGQAESFLKYAEEFNECDTFNIYNIENDTEKSSENNSEKQNISTANMNEFVIAFTYISGRTSWQNLDYVVRKTFKDYLARIDPGTNLGLNTDSITSYHLGEAKRGPEMGYPELLPCGYIIGHVKTLYICLQGVGSLAFDTLIPRSIIHRYISLLTEHRRLILCGPSGTGKSYLARKLAEFLVIKSGKDTSDAIATINVDHKASKELQQYLGHIAEQASNESICEELPSVIILDNLHHASELGDVFSCLLSAGPAAKLPCIIGTMSQATCNTTNLQLHHNFRWILTANHMEPVKGFLARYLRRKLFLLELATMQTQPELEKVLKWIPAVWQKINSHLETYSSSDVTIGPNLFLDCPMDMLDSQVWFTNLWNYHLSKYLVGHVREGVALYGKRGAWTDPCTFLRETWPWPVTPASVPKLRQITPEEVGLEGNSAGNTTEDPLLNMLLRLQEAANYNGNIQEQDSDCDSNITHDSSAGLD